MEPCVLSRRVVPVVLSEVRWLTPQAWPALLLMARCVLSRRVLPVVEEQFCATP